MLSQTCINLFIVVNTKEDISKNVGNQTVAGPLDRYKKILWNSLGTSNCLVFHILQNNVCSAEERNSLRFKTNFEWVNDGINIKHYDRIDRQMTKFIL